MALHYKVGFRFLLPLFVHLCCKTVPTARDRQDVTMLFRRIAQGFAEHGYVLGEVGLFDEAIRPEAFHQFIFSHHAIAVLKEDQESVKGFGHERDRFLSAQQETLARIKPEGTEPVEVVLFHRHTALRKSLETS